MDAIDRRTQRIRPDENPVGYQRWSDLTFLHWRVDREKLQALLPPPLEVDCYEGDAWLGLVPFQMSRVRFRNIPALPWVSKFPETNLRTYVLFGNVPGVWFFSLEASRLLAVLIGRKRWNMNYFWARMSLLRTSDGIEYRSRRFAKSHPAHSQVRIRTGNTLVDAEHPVSPGSLEDFLVERYLLFTEDGQKNLLSGQVHHAPYSLQEARVEIVEQTISESIGFPLGEPEHSVFSPGVDTELFGLRKVGFV